MSDQTQTGQLSRVKMSTVMTYYMYMYVHVRTYGCNHACVFVLQAMRMIEEETRRYKPSKNYLENFPPTKNTFEVMCTYVCTYLLSVHSAQS